MKNYSKYSPQSTIVIACEESEGWVYYLTSREKWKRGILGKKDYASFLFHFIPKQFNILCLNTFYYKGEHREAIFLWRKNGFVVMEYNFNK